MYADIQMGVYTIKWNIVHRKIKHLHHQNNNKDMWHLIIPLQILSHYSTWKSSSTCTKSMIIFTKKKSCQICLCLPFCTHPTSDQE